MSRALLHKHILVDNQKQHREVVKSKEIFSMHLQSNVVQMKDHNPA
jgi:hypothetical protein